MEKVLIYFFSGTGNTEIIAQLFREGFTKKGCKVSICAIEKTTKSSALTNINSYDIIGFGHPVHAFGAPTIFHQFIKKLPFIENKRSFYFKTAGDPIFNGGSNHLVRKNLSSRGYKIFNESLLVMPSNVLIQYNEELVKQLYNTAIKKIAVIVDQILGYHTTLQKDNILIRLFSNLFNKSVTIGAKYFGKYLYALNNCSQCQLCINHCPTNNINYIDGKVEFGNECTFCMRCVYICPEKAIRNKYMNFVILKNRYSIKSIIDNPSITGNYISEKTKGYFKHFYKYLSN